MKRIFIIIFILFTHASYAQIITPYFPYRTPIKGQPKRAIQDYYLWVRGSLAIPYTPSTTPVVLTTDSVGTNLQMLSNGNIAISKGLGTGFFEYAPSAGNLPYVSLSGGSTILSSANNIIGLSIQGAPSQAVDITQWKSSGGTVVSRISNGGEFFSNNVNAGQIRNILSQDNSRVVLEGIGVQISRNINDSNPAVRINNVNVSSAGDIAQFQAASVIVASVNKAGNFVSTVAPTSGGHMTNKTYVDDLAALKAPLASPSFTGTPLVPTAAVGTNTTQAASTAFVQAILPIALVTAADQTLGVTAFISYTGTGGTFTLPTPASSTAKYWKIIHRGASGSLVINTNGASNVLYNSGALTNTISLGVGEMLTLLSDGTYIIVYP